MNPRVVLTVLLLAVQAFPAPNPRVGFYQWAGQPPFGAQQDLLTLARNRVKATGAGLLRFYVGPRFDYLHPVLSPHRFTGLAERTPVHIIQLPHYRAALEDPELPTIVLTAYTALDYGAGYDDLNLLRPWTAREETAEYRQMFELASHLLDRYGSMNKTVVISNTEADDKMLEVMNYTGSAETAIRNLRAWQNARYRAMDTARREHPQARLRLLSAFEISLVNMEIIRIQDRFSKHATGQWNALRDVVPHVAFDLLSYSAYESTNSPFDTQQINTPPTDVGTRLLRDLSYLRETTGKPVMIGELGFPLDRFDRLPTGGVPARLAAALRAVGRARPEFVVFWQVFDAPLEGREPIQWGWLHPRREPPPILLSFIRHFR